MIETDQPSSDQMDTETTSLDLGETGEGRVLTTMDNILSLARNPSSKVTVVSDDAQQITCKRQRGSSESGISPATPQARASTILHQHYVSETMQILRQPRNFRVQIVEVFDISRRGRDFGTLQDNKMFSDRIIDWILRRWTTKIGGGKTVKPEEVDPETPKASGTREGHVRPSREAHVQPGRDMDLDPEAPKASGTREGHVQSM